MCYPWYLSGMAKKLADEGTVWFRLIHDCENWRPKLDGYSYWSYKVDDTEISYGAEATPDRRLHVSITGPFGGTTNFDHQIPESESGKIHVAISWEKPLINLYVNGNLVETVEGPRPVPSKGKSL